MLTSARLISDVHYDKLSQEDTNGAANLLSIRSVLCQSGATWFLLQTVLLFGSSIFKRYRPPTCYGV